MLIADIGAVPCIAIKSNVKSKSYGYPAREKVVKSLCPVLYVFILFIKFFRLLYVR